MRADSNLEGGGSAREQLEFPQKEAVRRDRGPH